jgi:hypothetical protein
VDQLLTLSRVEADDARSRFKGAAGIIRFHPRQGKQLIHQPGSARNAAIQLFQRMGSHRFIVDGQLNHFALYLQRGQRAAQLSRVEADDARSAFEPVSLKQTLQETLAAQLPLADTSLPAGV